MDYLRNLTDSFGVHIEAKSAILRSAATLLILTGIVSVAKPILSFVRVLLSLFILPGQSVSPPCAAFSSVIEYS